MQQITSTTQLRNVILVLEIKQASERQMLMDQLHVAFESVKPINLIKSTLKEVNDTQDLKDNLLNTTVGIAAGVLSKKLFVGFSSNPVRKLFGTALMFAMTNAVTRNPDAIKAMAKVVLNIFKEFKPEHIERSR